MITVSGDTIRKFALTESTFSPISKVEYYDTPYSVPSWGFKRVFYHNVSKDGVFRDSEIIYSDFDPVIAHGWGEAGPPVIGGRKPYLVRWYGYFRTEHFGVKNFFISMDDGARLFIGSTVNTPEGLTDADEVRLDPVAPGSIREPWFRNGSNTNPAIRSDLVTYSGYRTSLGNQWLPMRIDYGMFDTSAGARGDICLRYRDADTGLPNTAGDLPQPEIPKLVSAGTANYPVTEKWVSGGDAGFIRQGGKNLNAYDVLRDVISIKGNRGIGKVGVYTIRLPLGQDYYRPAAGLKGIYRHRDSQVLIRPGRLVDVWAGYQTKCFHFRKATDDCALGILPEEQGGYYKRNLCSSVNQTCPFQTPMGGDLVKRFRGRITKIETIREKDQSYLDLTCHDNLYYLQTSINENWPDRISYAMFDYNAQRTSPFNPDGTTYPKAWDGFLLQQAVEDLCIKSNIDPHYLYKRDTFITTGLTYSKMDRKVQGSDIRLTKPSQYGNAITSGPADDPAVDDQYLWTQGYGEPCIDMVSSLADNYGFLFTCGVEGDINFRTRNTPVFGLANDARWIVPAAWTREVDKRALGGSYLFGNNATPVNHAKIMVSGSKFELYMGLDPGDTGLNFHNIQNHEGVSPPGWTGGVYEADDVESWNQTHYNRIPFFGCKDIFCPNISTPNYPLYEGWLYRGNTTWIRFTPTDGFNITSLNIVLTNGQKYIDPVLASWGFRFTYKCDVEIGAATFVDKPGAPQYKFVQPDWSGSPTKIVDGHNITEVFSYQEPTNFRMPTTSFAVTAGTTYYLKFTTRPQLGWSTGTDLEFDLRKQLDLINLDRYWNDWFKRPIMLAKVSPIGLVIKSTALPDPRNYRVVYQEAYVDPRDYAIFNGNFASPVWEDAQNPGLHPDVLWDEVQSSYFIQLTLTDDIATPVNWFGITVTDPANNIVYDRRYPNNLASSTQNIRFSTEGVDLTLGRNPSIFPFRSESALGQVVETLLVPDVGRYLIHVSGLRARVEGVAEYHRDPFAYKMAFDTKSTLYNLTITQDTADIRNDVVVVGRLKGSVIDPNTNQVVNPNNPTFDYVYSRAMDAGSIGDHLAENSMGKNETFVIFEPGVANEEHADWLARTVLDRYHKIQNQVQMDGLVVPYLDLEDSVTVADTASWTSNPSNRYWIEEIDEDISESSYQGSLVLSPLPPWPSFIPTPPPDINDFKANDSGYAQLIVDIRLIDDNGNVRWDGATLPGTNYDPYESEGAAVVNNPAKKNNLKLTYKLMVAGELNIQVRDVATDNIVAYLVGGGENNGANLVFERRGIGVYEEKWDAIDVIGASRIYDSTQQIESQELIVGGDNTFAGIYAKGSAFGDGRYYVVFEFNSFEDTHHDPPANAERTYTSKFLPTIATNGKTLNDATNGRALNANRHEQYWKLTLGEKTKLHLIPSPTIGTHPQGGPRSGTPGNTKLLFFRSDDNNGQGLKVNLVADASLTGTTLDAHRNRLVKCNIDVDSSCFVYAPFEELTYDQDDDVVATNAQNRHFYDIIYGNGSYVDSVFIRDELQHRIQGGAVGVNDGVSAGTGGLCQAITHDDQYHYNMIVQLQNQVSVKGNGEIVRFSGIRSDDQFKELKDSTVLIDPRGSRIRHTYNKIPAGKEADFRTQLLDRLVLVYGRPSVGADCVNPPSMRLGFRNRNLVFAARWFTVVYDIWDRSGRAPLVTNFTYDEKQGIGYVPQNLGYGQYGGRLIVRAHWLPLATDSTPHPGSLSPSYTYLAAGENNNFAFQNYTDPNWTGITDPPADSGTNTIQNHPVVCVCGDKRAIDVILVDDTNNLNNMSTTDFNNIVSKYAFYAWPIHHFWKASSMGTNKATWTVAGSDSSNFEGFLHENAQG